jgi:hypothetical protein
LPGSRCTQTSRGCSRSPATRPWRDAARCVGEQQHRLDDERPRQRDALAQQCLYNIAHSDRSTIDLVALHWDCIILDHRQIEEVRASRSENFTTVRPASPGRVIIFGFQGGESAETVARKMGYMQDAQQRWDFMTHFDLSTIKNEVLSSMVRDRSGISEAQAKSDVQAWMRGKQF